MTTKRLSVIGIIWLLILAAPIIYYGIPQYYLTPDILYAKAKVLWVSEGGLFTDPVSGLVTFHPPYYHLILSLLPGSPSYIDTIFLIISILNVGLTALFAYLLLRRLFDETVALTTALLLPFINQYMGPGYLFLSSAFSFSFPIMLAGLWLYVRRPSESWKIILVGVLWGAAFLISPVYMFLIGLIIVYEILFRKKYRRGLILAATLMVMLIPFWYQTIIVYRAGMESTSTFALWRGIPDGAWLLSLPGYMLSPRTGRIDSWMIVITLVVIVIGIIGYRRAESRHYLPVIGVVAYLLTFYHFSPQYASRIWYIAAIFLVAHAVQLINSLPLSRKIIYSVLTGLVIVAVGDHVRRTVDFYGERIDHYRGYRLLSEMMNPALERHLTPGEFVLAEAKTYRRHIMPFHPVHGLLAYRSGEYYQLTPEVAGEMLDDYNLIMQSTDFVTIDSLCDKYGIGAAVWRMGQEQFPVFEVIRASWQIMVDEEFFKVYRKP